MSGAAFQPISGEWADMSQLPVAHVRDETPPAPVQQPTLARLSVVLPFVGREVPRVLRLLEWIEKLSGQVKRTLYLLPFKGLDITEVKTAAARAFADVQVIADAEGKVSDWSKRDPVRDAAGPNSLFRQAAWYFEFKPLGPWLWLEPDCVPLVSDWDSKLEEAYRSAGKHFLGAPMRLQNGDYYLNGVAVYPPRPVTRAPSIATQTMWTAHPEKEIAFDVAGAAQVLNAAARSTLIQLGFGQQPPRDGAVLYHGDDGSLLEKLLSGGVESSADHRESTEPVSKRHADPDPVEAGVTSTDTEGTRSSEKSQARKNVVKPSSGSSAPSAQKVCEHRYVKSALRKNKGQQVCCHCGEVAPPNVQAAAVATKTAPKTESIGDQIRAAVATLAALSTNANRRERILKELQKVKLARRR